MALVVLNLDSTNQQVLQVPFEGRRYTFSAASLLSKTIDLNGVELKTDKDGTVPQIVVARIAPGAVQFAPQTITFIVFPKAENPSCK